TRTRRRFWRCDGVRHEHLDRPGAFIMSREPRLGSENTKSDSSGGLLQTHRIGKSRDLSRLVSNSTALVLSISERRAKTADTELAAHRCNPSAHGVRRICAAPHVKTIQICLNDRPATLWQASACGWWSLL